MLTLHRKKQKKTKKNPKTIIKRQTKKNRRYTKRVGGRRFLPIVKRNKRNKKHYTNDENEFEKLKEIVLDDKNDGLNIYKEFENFIERKPNYYKEIVIAFIKKYGVDKLKNINNDFILRFPEHYKEIVINFLKQDRRVLEYVNKNFIERNPCYYKEIMIAFMEQYGVDELENVNKKFILKYPHYYKEIAIAAVIQNDRALINRDFRYQYPEYYEEIKTKAKDAKLKNRDYFQRKYSGNGNESGNGNGNGNKSEKGNENI